MPGSCSSNTLNGCSSCGPGLVLFQLSASTSQAMVGFGCLNGDNPSPKKVYFEKSSLANNSSGASEFYEGVYSIITQSSSSCSYTENITCFSDPYGVIICTNTVSSDGSSNGFFNNLTLKDITIDAGSQKCSKKPRKSSCEPEPETICQYDGDPVNCACFYDNCTESISCTSRAVQGSVSEETPYNRLEGSYSFNEKIASEKDLQFFYGLCKSSVSTKMGILTNNKPQNCDGATCGEGKDACWGGGGCFGISDNNLDDPEANTTTSQKLKFKIGTAKEGFSKKYKSVSGKVKFYYGGTGGKTPCCDDDFDGTVVKEVGYSISAGSTFKNDYFASDAGDFDNNDQGLVGETICPCYTIDSVSFI
jgi:hypothetical protein